MKKLFLAALACALFAPAFAVENVYVTGDIQTIGLNLNNKHLNYISAGEYRRGTTNRVLFGFGADLIEDVAAKVTLAHRNQFGHRGFQGENVSWAENQTFIAEAYVTISNVFDALEVKVGRQFYGNKNSPVMYYGPDFGYGNEGQNTYQSVAGVTVTYRGEKLTLTAAHFDTVSTALIATNVTKLSGLDLELKLSDAVSTNAYVYDERRRYESTNGFWGLRPNIDTDHFKLGVEYARQYGAVEKGWLLKADLALPIGTDETQVTPRATYFKTEKGFGAHGNYHPGLMFGTGIGILAASNMRTDWEVFNIGLCMKFANLKKWGFSLDFYTLENESKWLGNSWEAKVVYNHNQYVAFHLGGAILTNVYSWKNSPTLLQLGMNVKF